MSNNDSMLNLSRKSRLSAEVTFLMLKGAGYAAAAFVGIWIVLAVMGWFGERVLPADSRATPDPAPQAFIDMAERARAQPAAVEEAEPAAMEEAAADEAAPADDAVEGAEAATAADDGEEAAAE